jgi:hypothetical protein
MRSIRLCPSASAGALSVARVSKTRAFARVWICRVASGDAGPPQAPETLMPLYSGGWQPAVTIIPPAACRRRISEATTGVGVSRSHRSARIPCAARIRAACAANASERNRVS